MLSIVEIPSRPRVLVTSTDVADVEGMTVGEQLRVMRQSTPCADAACGGEGLIVYLERLWCSACVTGQQVADHRRRERGL